MFEHKAIRRATLDQRMLHPGDHESIFADPRLGVEALVRSEIGHVRHGSQAAAVEIDDAAGNTEEWIDPLDVVADVIHQVTVARSTGAIKRAVQMRVIDRRIVDPQFAPERTVKTVFIDHGVPALSIVRRLDQRKSQVAQRALVFGETTGGNRRAGAGCGLPPYPIVDVVPDIEPLQPTEIADAGAAG